MMAQLPNERTETKAAQAAAADKRIAQLDEQLGLARERLVILENLNHSLRTSFDLIVKENSRLAYRLVESDAAVNKAHSRIDQMKKVLRAAELEIENLAAAISAGNEKLEFLHNSVLGKDRYIRELQHLGLKPIENSTETVLAGTISL